jgi:hypothetical protein
MQQMSPTTADIVNKSKSFRTEHNSILNVVQNWSVVRELNLTRLLKEDPDTDSYSRSTIDEKRIMGTRLWHDFVQDRLKASHAAWS